LRLIRRITNEVLVALDDEFSKIYADSGRSSIPPERLLRALLLQAFYTIRCESPTDGATSLQLAVPLVRRAWSRRAGIGANGVHKESRTAAGGGGRANVSGRVLEPQGGAMPLSAEHFSVDGTQVAAWAFDRQC
jgi:hypothetical protein